MNTRYIQINIVLSTLAIVILMLIIDMDSLFYFEQPYPFAILILLSFNILRQTIETLRLNRILNIFTNLLLLALVGYNLYLSLSFIFWIILIGVFDSLTIALFTVFNIVFGLFILIDFRAVKFDLTQ